MTIRTQQTVDLVFILMRGSLKNGKLGLRAREGAIHTIFTSHRDADAELNFQLDREISVHGKPINFYWIDYRGVITTRKNDYIV